MGSRGGDHDFENCLNNKICAEATIVSYMNVRKVGEKESNNASFPPASLMMHEAGFCITRFPSSLFSRCLLPLSISLSSKVAAERLCASDGESV